MSYEISLERMLTNKNSQLSGRLPQIRQVVEPLMSFTQSSFPYYTPHNFLHSVDVEENMNWIVPDNVKEKMGPYEIFFLIISAWIHDWGMIAEESEDLEKIREEHHLRTERYLEKLYGKVHLSEHEARIIGKICKGHRKVDLKDEEYDDMNFQQGIKIRVRFLAALLRIADECDITHNRTPEVIYFSINPTGKSEEEYKKHLSITGVGQRDEKHKIYISAIAKDPKGARALRGVEKKIQGELNAVKSILAENEVVIDIIELQLETKGFIDKPIGFEVNKNKIVNLLIGDHLYKHHDVAIRELLQNAIDTCKLKEAKQNGFIGNINIKRTINELIIKDNGIGMDYYEAKTFLSSIGDSFYDPESFDEKSDGGYSPISQFGIGILSSFLISDGVTIETLKSTHEACKFTVGSVNEEWKYEKGSRKEPGTTIILTLNDEGKEIVLYESLKRYLLCPEVKIEYEDLDGLINEFKPAWDEKTIFERFVKRDLEYEEEVYCKKILELSKQDYDLIVSTSQYASGNLVIFNHGIYVGKVDLSGIDFSTIFSINLKKRVIDIQISRESVKENEKFSSFMYSVMNDVFDDIYERYGESNISEIISLITLINGSRPFISLGIKNFQLSRYPYIKSFVENAPILNLSKTESRVIKWNQLFNNKEIKLYYPVSVDDEIEFIRSYSDLDNIYINPFKLLDIITEEKSIANPNLLQYMLNEKGIMYEELDLRSILLANAIESDLNYPDIMPQNVKFVSFRNGIKPLVVVYENPVVKQELKNMLGSSYWGNIILWKQLIEEEKRGSYLCSIKESYDGRFNNIDVISEQKVYIDCSDDFIKLILESRSQNGIFNKDLTSSIRRYLKYLSYLPLIINNYASCLISLEVIDNLEKDIASGLQIERPNQIFERMQPNSKLFMKYFQQYGLKYNIVE